VDEILLKALEKDPEKRFQSAEMYRCALESVSDEGRLSTGHMLEASRERNKTVLEPPTISRPQQPVRHLPASVVPLSIRRSLLASAAAVLVCVLLLSYALKSALYSPSNTQASLPDFASLPVTWPANLIPIPQLTLAGAHAQVPRAAVRRRVNVIVVTDENGVRREIRSEPKNPFIRAMGHVVRPFRRGSDADRSTAAARVSTEPSTN